MAEQLVHIPLQSVVLEGTLGIPAGAQGIVLFAHGSGSSRHSPRNHYVAQVLRSNGLGTLLVDLLTEAEDRVYENRFDIDLLAKRLMAVTDWLHNQTQTQDLVIGYFGASTGAAAALKAAAGAAVTVGAVVSRGGRPDLAGADLVRVQAPTLLIVGGEDHGVIELNQQAYNSLWSDKKLVIIPGATHLFEEPGALAEVARLAANWFVEYLSKKTAVR